jgi:hypothetical protein
MTHKTFLKTPLPTGIIAGLSLLASSVAIANDETIRLADTVVSASSVMKTCNRIAMQI